MFSIEQAFISKMARQASKAALVVKECLLYLEAVSDSTTEVLSGRALSILILALLSTVLLVVRRERISQERQAGGPTPARHNGCSLHGAL